MKKRRVLLPLFAIPLVLTGCGGSDPTPVTPPEVLPDEYNILVKSSNDDAFTYELNKTKAEEGTSIVFKILTIRDGFEVKSVKANKTELTAGSDGKTYTFSMPDRSVTIVVEFSVTGDIVLAGEVVANLEKEGDIYVARNVKVSGTQSDAKFSFVVKSESGETTNLSVLDLDESKSFGTIRMTGDKDYVLSVGTGATYDFYFDPDANPEYGRCYIQRVGYDTLPTTTAGLEKLLITSKTVRSEYSIYPTGYRGAHFEIGDNTTEDAVYLNYDYKLYENNVSFAKVVDLTPMSDKDPMYVYKSYDEANDRYTVVDTFEKYQGKMMINDDYYRPSYNNNTAYSGVFDVMEGDDWGYRFKINEKNAYRNVVNSAHMPHYFLEREFYYAYRSGFDSDSGVSWSKIDIVPTANADGTFSVSLDSIKEINTNSTGGIGESIECAYVYDADMTFTKAGALTSLTYREKLFDSDKWDFAAHEAKTGQKGTTIKTINATYEYGNPYSGAPNDPDFDLSDYFISSFDTSKVQFFNSKLSDRHDVASGESYVGINDYIYLVDDEGQYNQYLVNKKDFYSPSTALDLWEYAPVASSNEDVISHKDTDVYYQMSASNIGKSTLTFNNHVDGTGTSFDLEVNVDYGSLLRYFYLMEIDSPITTAQSASVRAGGVYQYYVKPSLSTAPSNYHPVSENPSLLQVTSPDNSPIITIDVSSEAAKALTQSTVVKVYMQSDYYDGPTHSAEKEPLEFTILTAAADPTGTWKVNSPDMPNTKAVFTTEAYDDKGNLKGYILDDYYDSTGKFLGTDMYYFYYKFNNGVLTVKVYDFDVESWDSTGYTANDFYLDFVYEPTSTTYYVFLCVFEYLPDYESYWYGAIIGDFGEGVTQSYDLDVCRYTPFQKVK